MDGILEILEGYSLITVVVRIALAALCGAAVGLERTKRSKEAGIRTHIIIASTAALLMMVSKYAFSDLIIVGSDAANGIRGADTARIAAQVVSGISFLGAGVIFKNGNSVKGLTTAAGIWATAAIGLAIGSGMYIPGLILAFVVVAIQILFHKHSIGMDAYSDSEIVIVARATDNFKEKFFKDTGKSEYQLGSMTVSKNSEGQEIIEVSFKPRKDFSPAEIEKFFAESEDIISVKIKG